jgi:quercetin dioxygenase-like cupin family protein
MSLAVAGVVILCAAGILVAQQEFPNVTDAPVVLENDKVVVQRIEFEAGKWAGEHTHGGGQLAVVLNDTEMTYKENGKERVVSRKAGDVFWVEAGTHDHKHSVGGTAILITLK